MIKCGHSTLLLLAPSGQEYALEAMARRQVPKFGWKDVSEITLPDPEHPGQMMSVQPIIDIGMAFCHY
jgi:hypothetical protein